MYVVLVASGRLQHWWNWLAGLGCFETVACCRRRPKEDRHPNKQYVRSITVLLCAAPAGPACTRFLLSLLAVLAVLAGGMGYRGGIACRLCSGMSCKGTSRKTKATKNATRGKAARCKRLVHWTSGLDVVGRPKSRQFLERMVP